MRVTISIDNNKKIIRLPYVEAGKLSIDYGNSNNEVFDTLNGQIVVMGAEPLADVSISGSFPAYKAAYNRGTYKDPYNYIRFFRDNRKKPMRIVVTDNHGKELFNRLMAVDSFKWEADKVGGYDYSLRLSQFRRA